MGGGKMDEIPPKKVWIGKEKVNFPRTMGAEKEREKERERDEEKRKSSDREKKEER
jgi:hypothetical protein